MLKPSFLAGGSQFGAETKREKKNARKGRMSLTGGGGVTKSAILCSPGMTKVELSLSFTYRLGKGEKDTCVKERWPFHFQHTRERGVRHPRLTKKWGKEGE